MSKIDNSEGPNKFKRDNNGLLVSQQYIFKEDGSIDWRSMISDDHLYPNRDWFETRNKPVPKSVEGLEDNQLLIKLSGIREVSLLRGFDNVSYEIHESSEERAVVSCTISFIENYESPKTSFTSVANATLNNTDNFARKFLESIAENRSFIRCVRAYLNIPIVGADEIDKSDKSEKQEVIVSASFSPQKTLQKKAQQNGIEDFSEFKTFLRQLWKEGKFKEETAKDWNDYSDIPAKYSKILIGIISE